MTDLRIATPPGTLAAAWLVARKDLAIEFRTRTAFLSALVFALLGVTIFYFAWDATAVAAADLAPGVLWVIFTFAGLLGLQRSFGSELADRAIDGLLGAPISRESIYLGKALANLVFVSGDPRRDDPRRRAVLQPAARPRASRALAGIAALAAIGLVAVGTLFSAMAVNTRMAELLLPMLSLPFFVPIVMAAAQSSARLMAGRPVAEAWPWLRILVAFDIVFVTACTLAFPYHSRRMTSDSGVRSPPRPSQRDPLLGVAIAGVALVYVRALAFTPIEARQGAAQKIMYIHATSAFIALYVAFVLMAIASAALSLAQGREARPRRRERGGGRARVHHGRARHGAALGEDDLGRVVDVGRAAHRDAVPLVHHRRRIMLLRGAVEERGRRARYSAVLGILAALLVPFIHLSVYLFRTLHPMPILLKPSAPSMPREMLIDVLALASLAFTLLFVALLRARYRLATLRDLVDDREAGARMTPDNGGYTTAAYALAAIVYLALRAEPQASRAAAARAARAARCVGAAARPTGRRARERHRLSRRRGAGRSRAAHRARAASCSRRATPSPPTRWPTRRSSRRRARDNPDVELHDVGKRGGSGESARQEAINDLLVQLGREGKRVVRLKGGDPLVFGRGSEEAQALAEAGVRFEIVPGVTAGVAAAGVRGHPRHASRRGDVGHLRHRPRGSGEGRDADRLGGARARRRNDRAVHGREDAAAHRGGARRRRDVARHAGRRGAVGHAIRASAPSSPRSTTLADAVEREGLGAPVITVIGDVVALRDEIALVRPACRCSGSASSSRARRRRPAALRARARLARRRGARAAGAARRAARSGAAARGARPHRRVRLDRVHEPERRRVPLGVAARRRSRRARARRAQARVRRAARPPTRCSRAASRRTSSPTASSPRACSRRSTSATTCAAARVLYVAAEGARDVLPDGLAERGCRVDVVPVYRTASDGAGAGALREALDAGRVDAVTFASASAVRGFVEAVGAELRAARAGGVDRPGHERRGARGGHPARAPRRARRRSTRSPTRRCSCSAARASAASTA